MKYRGFHHDKDLGMIVAREPANDLEGCEDQPLILFSLDYFRKAKEVGRVWAENRLRAWSGPAPIRGVFNASFAMGPAKELLGYDPDEYPRSSHRHEHVADWVNAVATFISRVATRHYACLVQERQP
jgi:hypothetical protein